jgi:hypothetical protein
VKVLIFPYNNPPGEGCFSTQPFWFKAFLAQGFWAQGRWVAFSFD